MYSLDTHPAIIPITKDKNDTGSASTNTMSKSDMLPLVLDLFIVVIQLYLIILKKSIKLFFAHVNT